MRPPSFVVPSLLILFALISVITLRSVDSTYGTNQLLFFLVSIAAYAFISSTPYYWIKKFRWHAYAAILALLSITLIIGSATNGSVSWIRFGSYRLQPSEILKPILLFTAGIHVAALPMNKSKNIIRFMIVAAAPLALILLQPDLGTALVITAGLASLYFAGKPAKNITIFLGLVGIILAIFSWLVILQPYQKERIQTFIQPTADPLGSGYNARQAMIAVGSGGFWGLGFGNGLQSNLRFLPERHTDFLFATFSEETGVIGSASLISLYALLFFWIARAMQQVEKREKLLIILALGTSLFTQTYINIGMNIGVAPITGVPLPLFSLGGSSLLATSISLGIIESIRRSSFPANIQARNPANK